MDMNAFLKTLNIADVVARLQDAPDVLAAALTHVEETRGAVVAAREDLKLALANAEADAWAVVNDAQNGKRTLAAERDARIAQVVAGAPQVAMAREHAATMEREHGLAQAEYERAKTQLYAARALSELAAATLTYAAARPTHSNGRRS